jgi:deazaflavin-dependent oxidoreductase (nitroreductase family)
MRSRKYRVVTTLERASRLIRAALRAGAAPRAFALLETTGRRTGLVRHTPVGNGLDGDIFWLVAAHGTQAAYVRNLQAGPRVRVKTDGIWRAGTAVVLPGDDPAARSRTRPHQWDAAIGRMMATAPLTIASTLTRCLSRGEPGAPATTKPSPLRPQGGRCLPAPVLAVIFWPWCVPERLPEG